jgi:hypothetical protein
LIIEVCCRTEGQAIFARSWEDRKQLFAGMGKPRFGTLLFLFLVHDAVSARTVTRKVKGNFHLRTGHEGAEGE